MGAIWSFIVLCWVDNYGKMMHVLSLHSSAVAYLCGHLHTLGGLMPVLHSRHHQGTLELELGDWMDNRRWEQVRENAQTYAFLSCLICILSLGTDYLHLTTTCWVSLTWPLSSGPSQSSPTPRRLSTDILLWSHWAGCSILHISGAFLQLPSINPIMSKNPIRLLRSFGWNCT